MSNENNIYKKSKAEAPKMSRRFYGAAKAREPWYLKLIFWLLVVVLVGGGSITCYYVIKTHQIDRDAISVEVWIADLLIQFEKNIFLERDLIDEKLYNKATNIAVKNKELSQRLDYMFGYYFETFDENVDGYAKVIDYREKFETLSQDFFELNKVDPRLLEK